MKEKDNQKEDSYCTHTFCWEGEAFMESNQSKSVTFINQKGIKKIKQMLFFQ